MSVFMWIYCLSKANSLPLKYEYIYIYSYIYINIIYLTVIKVVQ